METTEVSPSGDGVGQDRDGLDPTGTAKQMAATAGATVKQEIASFASVAQDKVQTVAEEQRKTAAKAIGDFATAIQHAGDELADKDQSMAGHLIKQAADRLGDLAATVSDKRPEEMLQGLRDFSRSNPVAFAACSALAGFAIGRLVRSGVEPLDPPESDASAGVIDKLPAAPYAASPSPSLGSGTPAPSDLSYGQSQSQSQDSAGPGVGVYGQPDRSSSGLGATTPAADGQSLGGGRDDDLV